jgi:hypothetical protein
MSIKQLFVKIKDNESEIYITLLVLLISMFLFGLFRIISIELNRETIKIDVSERSGNWRNEDVLGLLVASKNGSKYHFPWCSGALRIKNENKIWFSSFEEAKASGYEKALNCVGLK